jgi:uncharacterized protein
MSSPQKTSSTNDTVTLALWSAAENGDLDELASALSRAPDINARNEHGVTALMRAAQSGHLKVVRVLLQHGADANITRNDKFTALALAAFFGHTEIVSTLMEHGADSKASTRHGTSPHMWATARTFNEVVDQLENPSPPKAIERVAPVKAKEPAVRTPVTAAVVRTLKEPPEIWDLVHEVPRGFNARAAFVARLKSMQKGFAFRLATVSVLVGGLVVCVLVLRQVQAGNESNMKIQPVPISTESRTNDSAVPTPVAAPTVEVNSAAVETSVLPARSSARVIFKSSHRVSREVTSRAAATEVVQPVVTTTEKSEAPVRSQSANGTKVSAPLSLQLIAPAKGASPKAKVIQWP